MVHQIIDVNIVVRSFGSRRGPMVVLVFGEGLVHLILNAVKMVEFTYLLSEKYLRFLRILLNSMVGNVVRNS